MQNPVKYSGANDYTKLERVSFSAAVYVNASLFLVSVPLEREREK